VTVTTAVAYTLAAGLVVFGLLTGWFQLRGQAALRARTHVPSDELAYLRGRYRRRLVTGVLLAVIGGLIAGAFLSGLEPQIDALIAAAEANHTDPRPELTPEQKTLVKVWGGYWTVVLVLVLVVFGFAFADAMATRRYALQQYRIIREDHQAKLRRDLAVYKAQQDSRRNGRGSGELPGDDDKDADAD
jgi:MFS family permease